MIDRVTDPDGMPNNNGNEIMNPNPIPDAGAAIAFPAGLVPGQVDVGDSFRGHVKINSVNAGADNIGGATGVDELTGVFQVLVTSVASNPSGLAERLLTLAPDPAFAPTIPGAPESTVIGLFSDSANNFAADFDDPRAPGGGPGGLDDGTPGTVYPDLADVGTGIVGTEESLIGTASDGMLWAALGFIGADGVVGSGDASGLGFTTLPGEGIVGGGPRVLSSQRWC